MIVAQGDWRLHRALEEYCCAGATLGLRAEQKAPRDWSSTPSTRRAVSSSPRCFTTRLASAATEECVTKRGASSWDVRVRWAFELKQSKPDPRSI